MISFDNLNSLNMDNDTGVSDTASRRGSSCSEISLPGLDILIDALPRTSRFIARYTSVIFAIQAKPPAGYSVYVVGDTPKLGSWDSKKAILMEHDSIAAKNWAVRVVLQCGARIEYKYIMKRDADEALPIFEPGENRQLITTGDEMILRDGKFGEPKTASESRPMKASVSPLFTPTPRDLWMDASLIVCSHYLPLRVVRLAEEGRPPVFEWDHSTVAGHMRCLQASHRIRWIGQLEVDVEEELRETVSKQLLEEFKCIAVFLSGKVASESSRYCDKVLKPLLHHIINTDEHISQDAFNSYTMMNHEMAVAAAQEVGPRDTVIALDYELFLFPQLLRRRLASLEKSCTIVFFHVSVFPSSEGLAEYAFREEILRGMLSSDLIVFLMFNFARDLLHCVFRLLGISHQSTGGILGFMYEGRHVAISTRSVGVDISNINSMLDGDFEARTEAFRGELLAGIPGKRRIVAGYDELDRLSGVHLKLKGWERFLQQNTRDKTTLVQYLYQPPQRADIDSEYLTQLTGAAAEINARYPHSVVLKFERLRKEERAALFNCAHVLLDTSIRRGQDLYQMEAILCSQKKKPAVVLSEFSSNSHMLGGAIRINPWNPIAIQQKLEAAFAFSLEQRTNYHNLMHEFVRGSSADEWLKDVLEEVAQVSTQDNVTDMGCVIAEKVHKLRLLHREDLLDTGKVAQMYKRNMSRLIVLDDSPAIVASAQFLQGLCSDERNYVCIISSCRKEVVEKKFAGIDGLCLTAEDGFFFKTDVAKGWESIENLVISDLGSTNSIAKLRRAVKCVMGLYTERTNASYIEERESSLLWHYEKCDREWAVTQGKMLVLHLREMFETFPMVVTSGHTFVMVRPQLADKGLRAEAFLRDALEKRGDVDMVLCLGEDQPNENVFMRLDGYGEANGAEVVTCTVGLKPSHAKYYLDDAVEVQNLFKRLSAESTRMNRHMSTSNLQSLPVTTVASLFPHAPADRSSLQTPFHFSEIKSAEESASRSFATSRRHMSTSNLAALDSEPIFPAFSPQKDSRPLPTFQESAPRINLHFDEDDHSP